MGKLLVTMDTLEPDRDYIEIDGANYFMRAPEELSLTENARLRKLSKGVLAGINGEDIDVGDLAQIGSYSDDVMGMVVLALPDAVRDKLRPEQKLAIIRAFTSGVSERKGAAETPEPTLAPPIMDGSSLVSSDSMEETPATG